MHELTMTISEFLVRAKKETYARGSDEAGTLLPDGAIELSYVEKEMRYRDRYYGWDPFAGEEVVTTDGKVIWLMNYYGRCLPDGVTPSQVYNFLVKALAEVTEEAPYRGPEEYEKDGFKYTCCINGGLESFRGAEKILYNGKDVYWLVFHGGEVAEKPVQSTLNI